jgi:hypothetical protein
VKYHPQYDEVVTSWSPAASSPTDRGDQRSVAFAEFGEAGLPEASRRYYRGTFLRGNGSWHQTTHNVYVLIQLAPDIVSDDICVDFQTRLMNIDIRGGALRIKTFDRLVPSGCFWTLERPPADRGSEAAAFLRLDLEKRYPLVNWQSLFDAEDGARGSSTSAPADDLAVGRREFAYAGSDNPHRFSIHSDSSPNGAGGLLQGVEGSEDLDGSVPEELLRQIPDSLEELLAAQASASAATSGSPPDGTDGGPSPSPAEDG